MDKEEALKKEIKVLRDVIELTTANLKHAEYEYSNLVKKYLLLAEPNVWVSVQDRLPNDGQDVLVIRYRQPKGFGVPESVQYHGGYFFGIAAKVDYEESTTAVTHWMPLPEAPAI